MMVSFLGVSFQFISACCLQISRFATAMLLLLILGSCGGGGGADAGGGNISEGLISLSILPANALLVVGDTLQYTATGHYDDGSSRDITSNVTWIDQDFVGGVSISSNGLATGSAPDRAIISAVGNGSLVGNSTFLDITQWRAEGSAASPFTLTGDSTHAGEVDRYLSYYQVVIDPAAPYYVFLNNPTEAVTLSLYGDAAGMELLCSTSSYDIGGGNFSDALCVTDPDLTSNTVLYLRVNGSNAGFDDPGANYDLLVKRGYNSEGTFGSRIPISLGVPYSGQVGNTYSFYTVPVSSGGEYLVTLTSLTGNANLELPVGFGQSECIVTQAGTTEESCKVIIDSPNLQIGVSGFSSLVGSSYTLTVTETRAAYVPDGTLVEPVALTIGTPHTAQVDGSSSYYSFASTPGLSYRITLTGQDNLSSLLIFDGDSGYSQMQWKAWPATYSSDCWSNNAGIADELCLLEPAGLDGVTYVEVDGYWDSYGTSYIILVEQIVYSAEGTDIPLPVGAAPASHRGQVGTTDSFYQATVEPGATYNIGLTEVAGDVDLYVYDDAAMTTLLCSSVTAGLVNESCRLVSTPVSGSVMYVKVVSNIASGAAFTLNVDRSYNDEGSISTPVDLVMDVPYGGQVSDTSFMPGWSYYRVPVTPGKMYQLNLSNQSANTYVMVLDGDATFDLRGARACEISGTSAVSCTPFEAQSSMFYILASSTGSTYGAAFTLEVGDVTAYVSEGVGTPINIGMTPVVSFAGQVDTTESHYMMSLATVGPQYRFDMLSNGGEADLYVYTDVAMTNLLCSSVAAGASESCIATPTVDTLYIKVDGSTGTFGAQYNLRVVQYYASEGAVGTNNQIALTMGTPYSATVGLDQPSYYTANPGVSTTYAIYITNAVGTVQHCVYEDNLFSVYSSCVFAASASSNKIYIKITPTDGIGGTFDILVNDGYL